MPECAWDIRRLGRDHVRDQFDCGNADRNTYLQRYARQNDERRLTATYVATQPGERRALGFVSLRAGDLACAVLPTKARKGLPRYPVPVVHIARLAVDRSAQGSGLGEALLMYSLGKAITVSRELGVRALEAIAVDDAARSFYTRYGFIPLTDNELHLYLLLPRGKT